MRKWILIEAEELIPTMLKTAEALVKYPGSEEPQHSGWSLHNATELPVFRALLGMPDRAQVFAGAMEWHAMLPGFSTAYLVEAFPWPANGNLTVIDVGGGLGHASRALAKHYPNVNCIVEDSPDAIKQAEMILPPELKGRLTFRAHDFFCEQPVKDGDIYLLRLVLHDWPDKYSILIIKALIPALRPGAKVVVNDRLIPSHGKVSYLQEREARDYDMYMLAFQNTKERTLDDWVTLFTAAGPRFKLSKVTQPPNSFLAVIELDWTG